METITDRVYAMVAHELAETQRAELDEMTNGAVCLDDREWIARAEKLPDLIDPEVT
ncbi:hypothetical protein [Streptomyces sp. NPDC006638]|uniref:hypothetical protein n=1 Tax=Streptomyces sp. NPDC006638 TaxID=3157183 RepID=UPI0033A73A8A